MIDLEADPPGEPADPSGGAPVSESLPSDPALADSPYDFDDTTGAQSPASAPVPAEKPAEASTAAAAPEASHSGSAAAAPPPAGLSAELTTRAAAVGYTPELIGTFKDPVQLELAVAGAERAAINAAVAVFNQQQAQIRAQQPVAPQAPAPPPPPPAFDENALRAQYRAMNYDEGLAEALIGQAKQNHEVAVGAHQLAVQNHRIMARLQDQDRYNRELYEHSQRLAVQHQRELIDRDYQAFQSELSKEQKALVADPTARMQIMQTADALLAGMAARGQQLPNNVAAFKQAMFAVLGEKLYDAGVSQVRAEVKTHQGRAVARPASSASRGGTPAGSSADRAGRFAEDFFRQIGAAAADGFEV
ncbi:MAG: hypothetical protein ACYCQK_01460 [Acidiferrobacteraceae bacterium]